MDLGGKYTQLGFEVICKKLTELEKENAELKTQIEITNKENAELEEIRSGQARIINNDTVRIERLEKENAELKQILYKLVNAFNDYECAGPEQEQENAWEILRDLMHEELFKF